MTTTLGSYWVDRSTVGLETWDRITFPNGAQMIYVEIPGQPNARNHHTYWRAHPDGRRGKQLSSGSKLGVFESDPGRLNDWIAREAASSGDADPGREKRELGTRVHRIFEALAHGEALPRLGDHPHTDQAYIRGLMRWWEKRRPEVLAAEQFVLHEPLGYAGRYDLRAKIDGETWLIDLKTANYLYPKYGAQLVAYDIASEWCGLGKADKLVVLKVSDIGEFYEVPAFVSDKIFLRAMADRKYVAEVAKQQRDEIKKIDAERAA